ncbi:MAG: LytTR family DNA-binding domain-containing protein [Pseudomonadota bacterium]
MKVLLVDDESLARQRLHRLFAKVRPEAELIDAENGARALELAELEKPQIVLLDIRMPELDGIEVVARLAEHDEPPAVIFCTAYDEYALQALEHQAIGYLLKPVRQRDLEKALANAVSLNRAQISALAQLDETEPLSTASELVSTSHSGVQTMPLGEVRCLLAEDKYVRACAPEAELLLSASLKELEAKYEQAFVRVHRNALVSLAHLRGLSRRAGNWYADLDAMEISPQVSRRHLSTVKEAISSRAEQ